VRKKKQEGEFNGGIQGGASGTFLSSGRGDSGGSGG